MGIRVYTIFCPTCGKSRTSVHPENRRCKPCYTESQKIQPNDKSTYKVLMTSVKSGAKKRGLEFSLTLDQYISIVSQNCYWCGEEPLLKNPKAERMPTIPAPANGIDRLNNEVGYVYANCVPSCQKCNVAKNNYDTQEFLQWVKKIYEFNFKENNA